MSVLKTSEVFKLKLKMSEKFVLLKLADCADDRGCNAFPSVLAIAASCGCTERTVRDALRRLESLGLLEVSARATNRRPTVYRVRPELGTVDPWFLPKDPQRGEICPSEDPAAVEGQILPLKPETVEGRELPPSAPSAPPEGQTAHFRGATFAPDPSKRDPSKIKTTSGAVAPRAVTPPAGLPAPAPCADPACEPQALLAEFDRLHQAACKGEPATITAGKDARLLADLVRKHGLEVVRERMRLFFTLTDDAWIQQRGFTVAMFRNVFARFAVRAGRAPAWGAEVEESRAYGAELQRGREAREAVLKGLAGQVLARMGTEGIRRRCVAAEQELRSRYPYLDLTPAVIREAAVAAVSAEFGTESRLREALAELERLDGAAVPA